MARYPIFVKRDLDGFFGLAVDNLVQLLLIVQLCGVLCGMTGEDSFYLFQRILPGVAVSLLIGNLFYAAQAHWVARREGRSDVTALPYGINTPSLLVYIFFVMEPTYRRSGSAELAWQMGLIACLGSGVIEFLGAFFAEKLRRNTPRAALLSTLAGIAIVFIALSFALQIWQRPLVAMVPLAIVLLVYFGHVRFPLGLPGGFIAVVAGTLLAWGFSGVNHLAGSMDWSWLAVDSGVPMSVTGVATAWADRGQFLPQWSGDTIWTVLTSAENAATLIGMLSVIVPMGLFNVIGSLQNIESAEAGGDVFGTGPSLAVNGLGTIAAALFGSCFPTTIYIGHPGWKGLGARAGYSTLNGIVMTVICLTGTVSVISQVVPLEAGIAIVLWIGIVITAQAFQASPGRHAPAAAIGLFPAIAAFGAIVVTGAFNSAAMNTKVVSNDQPAALVATSTAPASDESVAAATAPSPDRATPSDIHVEVASAQTLLSADGPPLGESTQLNGFLLHGLFIMERGYIFTCMIFAAIAAFLIDRRFKLAAGWCVAAAALTGAGLMHAYQLDGNILDYWLIFTPSPGPDTFAYNGHHLVIGYVLMAGVFLWTASRHRKPDDDNDTAADPLHDARVVPKAIDADQKQAG
jgi:AGZA family xanthine/uracil permease-like MFS transporter